MLRERGEHAFSRAEYGDAATNYGQIADRYPGDWEAQYRLGQSLLELDRPEEARRALEIAMTRRPNNADVADALAEAIYRTDNQSDLFAFLRGRTNEQQTVYSYLRLARYASDVGDPDNAKVALETAVEIDQGRTVEPYLQFATFAEGIGDFDLAVRRLRQAYGIDPRDERVTDRLIALNEVPGPTIALPPGR